MSTATVPLRRVFRIINGGTPTNDELYWNGEVPWATPVDLGSVGGGYLSSTQRNITQEGLLSGSRSVPAGSLILSTRAPIGYVAQATERTAFNQGCRGLVADLPVDARFFRYQLLALRDDLLSRGSGSTFMELSTSSLADVRVACPSLDEQRRIADFLDAETDRIDRTIAILEAARRVLHERRKAAVFAAVTGSSIRQRAPSNLAWVDTLPGTWQSIKINYVARMGSGHTPSRNRPEWWVDCAIPWVTTGEVGQMRSDRLEVLLDTREKISKIGLLNSSAEIHRRGTVVLCRTAASAGYSAVMGSDMATSQDIATWTCGPRLDSFFLLWCLRAMRTDLLERLAVGSTHKTIYMPDLQGLRIPLPDIDEQVRIVAEIRASNAAIDAVIDAIDRKLDLLAERRQALITAAITGQIDVTTARGVGV